MLEWERCVCSDIKKVDSVYNMLHEQRNKDFSKKEDEEAALILQQQKSNSLVFYKN